MVIENDTRGWIMSGVSGIACVVGSSIICVDLIVRHIPGKRNFRIQDSNAFLSSSLSLSFGVMLFSSLYSILPSAKDYLKKGGLSPQAASYATTGCFIGGIVGIQVVSRLLHHFIPSQVVNCDHTHEEHDENDGSEASHEHQNGHSHHPNGSFSEDTPLLSREYPDKTPRLGRRSRSETVEDTPPFIRRPTLQTRLTNRVTTLVSGAKSSCDENGPCYGFGDPCGQECLKAVNRSPTRLSRRFSYSAPPRQNTLLRTATTPYSRATKRPLEGLDEEVHPSLMNPRRSRAKISETPLKGTFRGREGNQSFFPPGPEHHDDDLESSRKRGLSSASEGIAPTDPSQAHHHHVPTNAFMAIGLQTSIAIALHKLPEGFITYATNHANPTLGFTVFIALFIHNITEGFAMALPLYLAINSRWKAMFWSSLLGGISQPLGAGAAALWFKLAGKGDMRPGETVYGCMFGITAGIMASVALQLFSESLGLTHNRNVCIIFAFLGMGILSLSFALTARFKKQSVEVARSHSIYPPKFVDSFLTSLPRVIQQTPRQQVLTASFNPRNSITTRLDKSGYRSTSTTGRLVTPLVASPYAHASIISCHRHLQPQQAISGTSEPGRCLSSPIDLSTPLPTPLDTSLPSATPPTLDNDVYASRSTDWDLLLLRLRVPNQVLPAPGSSLTAAAAMYGCMQCRHLACAECVKYDYRKMESGVVNEVSNFVNGAVAESAGYSGVDAGAGAVSGAPAVSSAAASANVAGEDVVDTGIGELKGWEPRERDIIDWSVWLAEE